MRFLICLIFGGMVAFPVLSQTAERIDEILDQEELTAGAAAYIAAASGDVVSDSADGEEALAALAELGFPANAVSANQPIRLDQFSYMLMLAHERSGGLFYSLFTGPRYALRELEYDRVVRGGGDPNETLTGSRGLRLVGRLITIMDAEG